MTRRGMCLLSVVATIWALLMLLLGGISVGGCTPNTEPLERVSNKILDQVVGPAVIQALEDTNFRTYTLQGGGQLLEPGWDMEFEGVLVNGVRGKLVVKARGVAGQLQGHAQGDNEAESASQSGP